MNHGASVDAMLTQKIASMHLTICKSFWSTSHPQMLHDVFIFVYIINASHKGEQYGISLKCWRELFDCCMYKRQFNFYIM